MTHLPVRVAKSTTRTGVLGLSTAATRASARTERSGVESRQEMERVHKMARERERSRYLRYWEVSLTSNASKSVILSRLYFILEECT